MATDESRQPPYPLSILYRGPLTACDYDCWYCPFRHASADEDDLRKDRKQLERFVDWIASRPGIPYSVFFTPSGEALTHSWYRDAIQRLSLLPNIRKVAVQTNLSCELSWLRQCDTSRIGLWCTYHPAQAPRELFLEKCATLSRLGIRFSVGAVGVKAHFDEIEKLRERLPGDIYLWINAYKHTSGYYQSQDVRRLLAIDPLFEYNLHPQASFGKYCACGHRVISMKGDGSIRRCFFASAVLGNIYENPDIELSPSPCPLKQCGCHIGYVHMPHLGLGEIFGEGILERVPTRAVPAS